MKTFAVQTSLFAAAIVLAGCATSSTRREAAQAEPAATLAPMPEPVTSFGAVTAGDWLYVFGGHKGERHEYSAAQVSGAFHRLKLSAGTPWEMLPASAPSQGLPLVAHAGQVYRIGGMAARNPEGEKQDLISTDHFERFDPARGQWEKLPNLPAPRSSHDAVVLGDRIYVAGGWELSGRTSQAVWPANALVFDLKNPDAGWREFPQPFQRRALALAAQGSRIYCIGGMDDDNQTTLAVDVFDTTTGQWSQGPELPAGRHKGFSCSAIAQHGRVYANMFQGDLLRLTTDGAAWDVVGHVEHPRLSHRLVTAGTGQLIVLGGEDGEDKRPELELLTPSSTPRLAAKPAADDNRQ